MAKLDLQLRSDLESIYKSMLWLRKQPNVTDSRARAWYSHVMAKSVLNRIRLFSGKVSKAAILDKTGPLVLEHFEQMQTRLTGLVATHHQAKKNDPGEFISLVRKLEQVHIVTRGENYAARREKGNYRKAKISLVSWIRVPPARRRELWKQMLKGRVCNAGDFSDRAPPRSNLGR